ncbi:unnamed protein product [Brachionus calyciflorus]|uniref:RING-type domain-containing protein n=1 Tax=Brachionus calyciflorus TaxID=104777 RepID=A0A813W1N6_9BILA|nr:unnamed protein product [Brachionus calyciflorus]
MTKTTPTCSNCSSNFNFDSKEPKVLPCGNSICSECSDKISQCQFCQDTHQSPFPTNKFILSLLTREDNDQESMDKIKQKNKLLEINIKKCYELIDENYSSIEKDINTRTERIIEDIKKSRDTLLEQVRDHKAKTSIPLDNTPRFKITKNQDLNKLSQNLDLNLKRVNFLMGNLHDLDIKFVKSNLKIDQNSFIGRLDSIKESDASTFRSSTSLFKLDDKKFTSFEYKIPFNCKNILLGFLPNRNLIKIVEMSLIDQFQYSLNIDLIEENRILCKTSEIIGAYRLRKVITNNFNNFFILLITNKFSNSLDYLKIYNENLELCKTKSLNVTPSDLYMSDKFIYLYKSNCLDKFDYSFKLVNSLNFQQMERGLDFYVPKNYNLIQVQNDRLYFIDMDKSRIRIMSELNGKLIKSFEIEFVKDDTLVKLDSNDLIYVFNKRVCKLIVYNVDGILVAQKKLDLKRIDEIDYFHVYSNQSYSILDLKNHLIHYF